jgi:hypothetical protein
MDPRGMWEIRLENTQISGSFSYGPSDSLLLSNRARNEVSNPNSSFDTPKAVVAVLAGVSLAAITICQGDIDHLPHGDEVDAVLRPVSRSFHQFPKEILD